MISSLYFSNGLTQIYLELAWSIKLTCPLTIYKYIPIEIMSVTRDLWRHHSAYDGMYYDIMEKSGNGIIHRFTFGLLYKWSNVYKCFIIILVVNLTCALILLN